VLRPTVSGVKRWAWKYILPEVILPIVSFAFALILRFSFSDAGIIVSALGVLGGLLFAHAIFVFQLRMSYTESLKRRIADGTSNGEDTRLTRRIDELFDSVVYCSGLALAITIVVGTGSSLNLFSSVSETARTYVSAVLLALLVHLSGCIYRVLKTTSSAYAILQKQKIV
jgi:hypothetical protein